MSTIYIIALEITIILLIYFELPIKIAFLTTSILIGMIFIFNSKKEIVLLILPILFMIRIITSVDFLTHNINEINTFSVSIHNLKGKVVKINNHFPLIPTSINVENIENGNYNLVGKITSKNTKYGKNFYSVKIIDKKLIKPNFLEKYFSRLSDRLLNNSSYQLKRVFKAIILGKNEYLTKELKEVFSYIGISHILALSGFHIGIVICIFSFILNKCNIEKSKKNILLVIFLSLYYLGIKHSPSLNRAYFMGIIFLLGNIFYENTELMKSLFFSYVLSLFIFPLQIREISFILSYTAVFLIIAIYPIIKKYIQKNKVYFPDSLLLILVLQIFLIPVTINEFGTIQVLSFISNIILIPIASIFITLCFTGLVIENFYLGFIILPFIKIFYWIFIKLIYIINTLPLMSIKINNGLHSKLLYFIYFIILFVIRYIYNKKGVNKNEKLYK